ncbi:MAG: TetR/AcrR family transcriptional regulator [Bacillota bacterium]
MDGFQKRTIRKQNAILEAAYRLFLKQGVRATPVALIAKEAQVSQVTIYNYFNSKQTVVRRVVQRLIEDDTKAFEAIVYDASTRFSIKMDRLIDLLDRKIDEYDMALIKELVASEEPTLSKVLKWYVDNRLGTAMAYFVREGLREGKISDTFDEQTVIDHFAFFDFASIPHKDALKKHLRLLLFGLKGTG